MPSNELRRIRTVVGATGRKLRFQIRRPDTGAAFDLTSYAGATITARVPGAAVNKIDGVTLTIEAGTDGWAYFYPAAGHVDTAADLYARITLDPNTGTLDYSERFVIEVEDF